MINGKCLKNAIISGANNISREKSHIDDLNIFPVPDGDTGTNMSMTINSAVSVLGELDCDDVSTVAKTTASALLRGARGNSGVILSLIFRGFSIGLRDKVMANGSDLVKALGAGVEAAYKAVMKPTEGTILTVARMAYEAGNELAATNDDPVAVWETVVSAANDALELTPEMLPVLKKANVVDAGGKGLCTIFEGMLSVFRDGKIVEYAAPSAGNTAGEDDYFRSAAAQFDDDITYTYCTEFIVGRNLENLSDPQLLRNFLQTIGDCVVVVDDEEIIKVHVHTENPGKALQAGLDYGQLLTVKVENMKEQHRKAAEAELKAKMQPEEEEPNTEVKVQPPVDEIGFVAVAAGSGLVDLFKECGCANVVSGGQSMNPSTNDILSAVLATPAKRVVILPNNKNIIMAAEQTVPLVNDREVIVLQTKTIPQGLSALLSYDFDLNPDDAVAAMKASFANVQTGLVTFAARDSEFGIHRIKEGEIIALENGKLTVTEKDIVKAAIKVTKNLIKKETAFITVISGQGVSEEQSNKVVDHLKAKYGKNIEITYVNGGQPVYYFIISVE